MTAVVELVDLRVSHRVRRGGALGRRSARSHDEVVAVDSVSLTLDRGQVLGVVGESGSGKTSLARCVAGFQEPTSGQVLIDGEPATSRRSRRLRRRVQMIFQDPYSSLNPTMTVLQAVREPIAVHGLRPKQEIDGRATELMELVGLDPSVLHVRPRQLSGGQRQRVSIARALALEPEVLVADEPVSALDVSVQAVVLNLLADLRTQLDMSVLFISHDMSVVAHLCDDVAVMTQGRIVERGPTDVIFASPQDPYTQQLLSAVPPHPWAAGAERDPS